MPYQVDESDPACAELVRRATGLNVPDDPEKLAYPLGLITLADGRERRAHVLNCADLLATDGVHVLLIRRKNPPGQGLWAFPGGFMDPHPFGRAETTVEAATREGEEESNLIVDPADGIIIGHRNVNRPFDVRIAFNDNLEKNYAIKRGEVFLLSTLTVRFNVPDLTQRKLIGKDDAKECCLFRIDSLTPGLIGIPDHVAVLRAQFPGLMPPQDMMLVPASAAPALRCP